MSYRACPAKQNETASLSKEAVITYKESLSASYTKETANTMLVAVNRYGINAKAEAVTESDLFAWLNGNTIKDTVSVQL